MKEKDPYYEKLDREFNKKRYLWENKWFERGWSSLGGGLLFLLIFYFKSLKTYTYLYIGILLIFTSIIFFIIGHKKKST